MERPPVGPGLPWPCVMRPLSWLELGPLGHLSA
jgi:hypothetical protein